MTRLNPFFLTVTYQIPASTISQLQKPENVGFDCNGTPKLFDFGFAREAHNVRSDEIAGR